MSPPSTPSRRRRSLTRLPTISLTATVSLTITTLLLALHSPSPSTASPTPVGARVHPTEGPWHPTCADPLPLRYAADGQTPNYIVAPMLDMWANLQGIPRIGSLTAFCTDRERGLYCRCYVGSATGESVLLCLRYLHDDFPAKQVCMERCHC